MTSVCACVLFLLVFVVGERGADAAVRHSRGHAAARPSASNLLRFMWIDPIFLGCVCG